MGTKRSSDSRFFIILGLIMVVIGCYMCYEGFWAAWNGTIIPATRTTKESTGWENLLFGGIIIALGGYVGWSGYRGKRPFSK